jgi:hypothetical protein
MQINRTPILSFNKVKRINRLRIKKRKEMLTKETVRLFTIVIMILRLINKSLKVRDSQIMDQN